MNQTLAGGPVAFEGDRLAPVAGGAILPGQFMAQGIDLLTGMALRDGPEAATAPQARCTAILRRIYTKKRSTARLALSARQEPLTGREPVSIW